MPSWAVVVCVAVGLGLVLLAVDRMVARGWFDRPPRERPHVESGSAASGMFGDLVEIFQPNRVHLTAEQERQRLEIQQAGDAAPPIDLDAGVARVDARAQGSPASAPHTGP